MSNKISLQTIYKTEIFHLEREVKGMRMFWNKNENYCIIVDKDDNVLFEIGTDCAQNCSFLTDLTE